MNQTATNIPVRSLKAADVLDRKTLVSIKLSDINEPIYVLEDLVEQIKTNPEPRTGAIDYSLTNFLFIPASIMAKAKGDNSWLIRELNKFKYFQAASRSPTILSIDDTTHSSVEVTLNSITRSLPSLRDSQQESMVNHWTIVKLEDSYEIVYCGRTKKE